MLQTHLPAAHSLCLVAMLTDAQSAASNTNRGRVPGRIASCASPKLACRGRLASQTQFTASHRSPPGTAAPGCRLGALAPCLPTGSAAAARRADVPGRQSSGLGVRDLLRLLHLTPKHEGSSRSSQTLVSHTNNCWQHVWHGACSERLLCKPHREGLLADDRPAGCVASSVLRLRLEALPRFGEPSSGEGSGGCS